LAPQSHSGPISPILPHSSVKQLQILVVSLLLRSQKRFCAAHLAFALLLATTGARAAWHEPKHLAPIPAQTRALMSARNTTATAPVLIRTYKKEAELEVWKQAGDGRFVLLKTFPVCRWSGQLGPKQAQGDRQVPEGFYSVTPKQMNPNSAYYLSFNIGFANDYNKAHSASGASEHPSPASLVRFERSGNC
jgi:murein L,D-transpeptidase YafK